jgi:hypothetical protein
LGCHTLRAWDARGDCPFPPADPASVNAFLSGALGPDMGLFSPKYALVSNLSHYVQTGELCRAIVQRAETDTERAFAWGWVSHVLADVRIHVLVNRGVGELLDGDRDRQIAFAADPVAHVRVEVGMDAACFLQLEPGQPAEFATALDERSIGFLAEAFDATYGPGAIARDELLAAHREAARCSRWIRRLNEVHAAGMRRRWIPPAQWPFFVGVYWPSQQWSQCCLMWRPPSMAYAGTHPVEPAEWFLAELATHLAEFPERFFQLVDTQLADLPNYNLDLGYVEREDAPYPLTGPTLDQLAERRRETNVAGNS